MRKKPIFSLDPDQLERLLFLGTNDQDSTGRPDQPAGTSTGKQLPPEEKIQSANAMASLVGLEQPGGQIGRYKLLRVLGEGGMGIVYLAEQEGQIRRKVALKVIKPGMDSERVIARFENERQALALLDHPHIAHIYDAGTTAAGRPYFVMEHVKGSPITDYCDRHKLSIEDRLGLFQQVCHAVHHAHQKGIIHRDIKPSNILVSTEEDRAVPKIIDFGVAKATAAPLTDRTLFTEDSQLLGTPEYMSPEQAEMANEDIDTRSDIYSLGVLLYVLLAGIMPYGSKSFRQGGVAQIRKVICETDPETPSTQLTRLGADAEKLAEKRRTQVVVLAKCLHQELEWIPLKAMRKDRAERYSSASEFAEDIENYRTGVPLIAGPESAMYKVRKFARRNKSLVSSLAAVAAILTLATIVSLSQMVRANEAAEQQRIISARLGVESQLARQERDRAEEHELAARREAYASDMNLLAQALSVDDMGRARELLNRHRPASPNVPDLRGWEWRYFWQQCQSDAEPFCHTQDYVTSLSVSHDGQWLAIGNGAGYAGISVWDLQTRQRFATLASGVGLPTRVAFAPQKPLLAYYFHEPVQMNQLDSASGYIRLWDPETRQVVGELPIEGACVALEFSPDGQCLVSATRLRITLWSVAKLEELARYEVALPYMYFGKTLALAPDMSFLVHATVDNRVRVLDLSTGEERWSALATDENLSAIALSPDGKILASDDAWYEDKIHLWDMTSGKEIGRLEGHRAWISDLLFLPDGKTLLSASFDQTIRVWDVSDPTHGKLVSTLRGHNIGVLRVLLLPDGRTLISGDQDGSVYSWDIKKQPQKIEPVVLSRVGTFFFPPPGSNVLTVDPNGRVAQYEGPGYGQKKILFDSLIGLHKPNYVNRSRLVFSNDGRKIAMRSGKDTIGVWEVPSGTTILNWKCPTSMPRVFLNEGKQLVTFNWIDQSYSVWDIRTGQRVSSWTSTTKPGGDLSAFSADGRWCLSTAQFGGETTLRDLLENTERHATIRINTLTDIAFSPDSSLFAATSRKGIVKLWERETMREVVADGGFMGEGWSVGFSPDGNRLAAGGNGIEYIKIWDVHSRRELLTLAGKGTGYAHTAFSPEGNTLATLDYHGHHLYLWRVPSGEEIEEAEASSQQAERE